MPTFTVFQLHYGVNKCYINLDTYKILKYKTYLSIKQMGYMYKYYIFAYKLISLKKKKNHIAYDIFK